MMISRPHCVRFAGILAIVVALVMAGLVTAGVRAAPVRQATSIQIQNFAFTPDSVEVPVGSQVTWANADQAPHTATARDGSFDTGQIEAGGSQSVTLNTAGTFEYFCTVHPRMVATLIVRAAASAESPAASPATAASAPAATTASPAATPATMPNTGLSSSLLPALTVLGVLTLLLGISVTVRLRRQPDGV
ncbi:MAG TPA: cupredoxin family copper-binding protein [Herpetosiphonaceae bacterium]